MEGVRTKADVVFPSQKVAVFVHGCFWHGCPEHHRPTKSNTKWWAAKIETNKERDESNRLALEAAGGQSFGCGSTNPPTPPPSA